jgi:hypothetical protein
MKTCSATRDSFEFWDFRYFLVKSKFRENQRKNQLIVRFVKSENLSFGEIGEIGENFRIIAYHAIFLISSLCCSWIKYHVMS